MPASSSPPVSQSVADLVEQQQHQPMGRQAVVLLLLVCELLGQQHGPVRHQHQPPRLNKRTLPVTAVRLRPRAPWLLLLRGLEELPRRSRGEVRRTACLPV